MLFLFFVATGLRATYATSVRAIAVVDVSVDLAVSAVALLWLL